MTRDSYSVHTTEWGVYVKGALPVDDMSALQKGWKKSGFKLLDAGVATALKATLALVKTEKDGMAWRKAIDDKARKQAGGDPEFAWLRGTDTGESSLTIFSVLSEKHGGYALVGYRTPSIPYDASDFGRCHRLLKLMPLWRSRLDEVARAHQAWRPLVENWAELEVLYEGDLKDPVRSKQSECYRRMRELRGDK